MPKHHNSKTNNLKNIDITPITRLWLLRLLVPLGMHQEFIGRHGFVCEKSAVKLGLEQWVDPEDKDFDPKLVRNELRELHNSAELNANKIAIPKILSKNICQLQKLIGLSDVDCRILEFVAIIHNERIFEDATDNLGALSSRNVFYNLSILLDICESDICESLKAKSILNKSGIITLSKDGSTYLKSKLSVLSDKFIDRIYSYETSPEDLLQDSILPCSASTLRLTDYEHISSFIKVIRSYLKFSLKSKRIGVNVFLYGEPGTGKTQLTKALATALKCNLFEVASQDGEENPIKGEARLKSFRAAQSFFVNKKAFLLFDEVEDIFNDGNSVFGQKSTAQTRKAWMNHMLEENAVPTIWVSNTVSGLDPAFLRRFDMVIEIPIPPKKQRKQIIHQTCGDFIDQKVIERISMSQSLSPAVVTRAASVIRSIQSDLKTEDVSSSFESIINSTLESQGHQPINSEEDDHLPTIYSPDFINSDVDLKYIVEGLSSNKSGRLCLYGPPGTGKTAYGHWLADQIKMPLNIKKGSDLISKWVGGTEKNIANAFKEADDDGALLLIDEVDSFLQDRRNANTNWEVTGVNEMLTQMETFSGVFIASTNLMDGLDQAALRRFDLKIKFDYLNQKQTWGMFLKYCHLLRLPHPKCSYKVKLNQLGNITPGDFAAIARRDRFNPISSAKNLLDAIESECVIKGGITNSIGFV